MTNDLVPVYSEEYTEETRTTTIPLVHIPIAESDATPRASRKMAAIREWTSFRDGVMRQWKKGGDAKTILKWLGSMRESYPICHQLCLLGWSLAVTSVEAERGFSSLKLTKTTTRKRSLDSSLLPLFLIRQNKGDFTAKQRERILVKFNS